MCWFLLSLHVSAALVTGSLVTAQHRDEVEAKGRLVLLWVLMLGLALIAWPIMLVVAMYRYVAEVGRFRKPSKRFR